VVRRVLGARHPDVEDVAQDCAIEFVAALKRFRRESSVKHFASRVALQTAMNARRSFRAQKRACPASEGVDADHTAGPGSHPESHVARHAVVNLVCQMCDELPEAQSEVLALHCMLGYTVNEIAAICGTPLETVRSRLRLARQSLVHRALEHPEVREFLEETA
jgi:RNA polymerase sigma-70 factor (ECF subfamily)